MSSILLNIIVYCGKEDDEDRSAVSVCDRLCVGANITGQRGRTLYTDNYWISMKLATHFFENYGWFIVGTISPTDKKSRQDLDIPFLKLSNGARLGIARGWFREAVIKLKTKTGKVYYIQCTTWRDKKQVFLSSNGVGSSNGLTVRRHKKGKEVRGVFARPKAQKDYVDHFNAVDRNDRDSADYSTTIRTIRYYIRIFCWTLDRVVYATYIAVCYLVLLNVDWVK